MDELWVVEFNLCMNDIEKDTPSLDGELIVRGTDIFDVLKKAREWLSGFGFDRMTLHSASRCGFRKKGEKHER